MGMGMHPPYPLLSKAPIVESALDFRCPSTKVLNWLVVDKELKQALPDYPLMDMLRAFQGQFQVHPDKGNSSASVSDLGRNGTRMRSEASKRVVQFQKEGFVFSKLAPYINWDDFIGEAFRLWTIHKAIFDPSDVARIGIRFINRIEADSITSLDNVLKIFPSLPAEYNGELKTFLQHYSFAVRDKPYTVNLIQTVDIPINGNKVGLILDIDVFCRELFMDLDSIKKSLEEMREIKNNVFFNSLTKETIKNLI